MVQMFSKSLLMMMRLPPPHSANPAPPALSKAKFVDWGAGFQDGYKSV